MNAGVTEEAKYHELRAYTLTHLNASFIHQHVVDAFAAQNANNNTKPVTLAFALIGLHLLTEKNYSGKQVQRVHPRLAKRRNLWPRFDLPQQRGVISATDVVAAPAGPARDEMIRNWCASLWEAYRASHYKIIELVETDLT